MQPSRQLETIITAYTPVDGYGDLKQAIIIAKFKRDNRTRVHSISNSSFYRREAIYSQPCTSYFSTKETKSLLPAPYWVSYSDIGKVAGGIRGTNRNQALKQISK